MVRSSLTGNRIWHAVHCSKRNGPNLSRLSRIGPRLVALRLRRLDVAGLQPKMMICGMRRRRMRNHMISVKPLMLAIVLLMIETAVAQQIGNPPAQQGVTPPRGTYAIRNAHIITVSGPDIENGAI